MKNFARTLTFPDTKKKEKEKYLRRKYKVYTKKEEEDSEAEMNFSAQIIKARDF